MTRSKGVEGQAFKGSGRTLAKPHTRTLIADLVFGGKIFHKGLTVVQFETRNFGFTIARVSDNPDLPQLLIGKE